MERPWGLSGPEFLVLYGVVLAAVCVIVLGTRWAVRQRPRYSPGSQPRSLTLYEWAYLHDGANRVTDTAVAGLLKSKKLRIDRRRRLYATVAPPEGDDFQQMIMEKAPQRPSLSGLRGEVKRSNLCRALVAGLQERGLLISRTRHRFVRALWFLLPVLGVVIIARYITGVQLGYPVGGLVVEFLATLLAGVLLLRKVASPPHTHAGEQLLKSKMLRVQAGTGPTLTRMEKPEILEQPGASRAGTAAAMSVAESGVMAYPERRTALLLSGVAGGGFSGDGGSSGGGGFFGGGDGGGGGCGGGGCGGGGG